VYLNFKSFVIKKKLQIGFLIAALLVCATNVFCQKKRVKAKKINKVMMDFDYGIYSSQLIIESDFRWEASLKERNRWEHGIGRFYQVSVGKTIKKNYILSAGLAFNELTFLQTAGFGYWSCNPTVYGAVKIESVSRTVNLKSFEIPVEVKYKYQLGKFCFRPSFGIRAIFYTSKDQSVKFLLDNGYLGDHPNNDKELSHNLNTNFSLEIKPGISYKLLDWIDLKMEPFYRINLRQDQLLEDYGKTRISSFGAMLGVEYALVQSR